MTDPPIPPSLRERARPPAPAKPRRRKREETRLENDEKLLAAGRTVFLKLGFHGASLDQVSAAAGLTKGAVYARFDSKADLFLALLDAHVDARLEEMRETTARAKTPRAAADAAGRQWMERTVRHHGWALLVVEFRVVAARDRALLPRYRAIHRKLRDGLAAIFLEVHRRAGVALAVDADRWARLALGIGNGLLLERLADEDEDYPARFAEICDAIARGATT